MQTRFFTTVRMVACLCCAAGCRGAGAQGNVPANTPPAPPVVVIEEVEAGYATIRNHQTFVPRTVLYLNLNSINAARYTLTAPDDPASYTVECVKREAEVPATHAAAVALGESNLRYRGVSETLHPVMVTGLERAGATVRLRLQGVKRGDRLQLSIGGVRETINPATDRPVLLRFRRPVLVNENVGITFRPNISFVSNQKLANGSRKSVTQFPLPADAPSLGTRHGANLYARSDTVLSSEINDLSAVVSVAGGMERNVSGLPVLKRLKLSSGDTGFVPGHLEARFDTNERFSNSAVTLEAGIKRRTRGGGDALWESALRSETAPVVSLDTFFEYRLLRDANLAPHHFGVANPGLSVALESPNSDVYRSPMLPAPVQLLYGVRVWLLPFEQGAAGNSANLLEYRFNIGAGIPLPRFLGGDRRLYLQYADGANPASGYAITRTFQVRLEGLTLP